MLYEANAQFVAKIYLKEKLTAHKREKLKLLLNKNIKCDGLCLPTSLLYNNKGEFVGYLMPKASGETLRASIFYKQELLRRFPRWTRCDLARLCVTILEKIKILHENGVIIGDINPENILLDSSANVFFVDTDSYQIEGFPCPVGTVIFTAPEIQEKDYKTFLRTMGHENFAIATLLFIIMLPGKQPYAQVGGESQVENIKAMEFPYPFGEKSSKNAPDGPWRYMWSHLTRNIKGAFYQTFQKGEKYAKESARLGVDDWLRLFGDYLYLLESGKFEKQDSESLKIYPTRLKKNKNATYVVCPKCNKEFEQKGQFKLCYECYQDQKQDHGHRNEIYATYKCVSCYSNFEVTVGEYEFYQQKGLRLPKRCKDCR